jgi:hypothetical protein
MAASTPASTKGEGLTNTRTVVLNWQPSSVVTTTVYKIDDDNWATGVAENGLFNPVAGDHW